MAKKKNIPVPDPNKLQWKLESISIAKLQEFHKNPRILTKKAYSDLKNSIDKFGLIDKPIITHDFKLIGGHQRCKILQDEGEIEVECWVPNRELTEKEVEELNIRMNKNTGEWDFDVLANEWDTDDLALWGWSDKELGIDAEEEKSPDETDLDVDQKPILEIECDSAEEQKELYEEFTQRGLQCRLLNL